MAIGHKSGEFVVRNKSFLNANAVTCLCNGRLTAFPILCFSCVCYGARDCKAYPLAADVEAMNCLDRKMDALVFPNGTKE